MSYSSYNTKQPCYSRLGNSCISQTVAYTSNSKFYAPTDPLYWWDYVPVQYADGSRFPINNGFPFRDNQLLFPASCQIPNGQPFREYR